MFFNGHGIDSNRRWGFKKMFRGNDSSGIEMLFKLCGNFYSESEETYYTPCCHLLLLSQKLIVILPFYKV